MADYDGGDYGDYGQDDYDQGGYADDDAYDGYGDGDYDYEVPDEPAPAAQGGGAAAAGAGAPPSLVVLGRQVSYQVGEMEAVRAERQAIVDGVAETLFVSAEEALMLLRAANFNDAKLKAEWFDNQAKWMKLAGIHDLGAADPPAQPAEFDKLCAVCFGEFEADEFDAAPCGHWFCKGCWREAFEAATSSKGALLSVGCLENCGTRATKRLYDAYLSDEGRSRFNRWDLAAFVESRSDMKVCPNPKCHRFVRYPTMATRDIHCPCGKVWCYSCGRDAHEPASCHDAAEWRKRNQDEDMNMKWVLANTRPCPKCKMPIQKNQGCQQMVCGKHAHGGKLVPGSGCGTTFCWGCMKVWPKEGFGHKCEPWTPDDGQAVGDAQKDLKKFVSVVSKYDHNIKGISFAQKTRDKLETTGQALMACRGIPASDVDHLLQGIDECIEGRRVLANTYLFVFYHEDNPSIRLFRQHQSSLDEQLSHLQQLLEGKTGQPAVAVEFAEKTAEEVLSGDMERFYDDRRAIVEASRAVGQFRQAIVGAIQNADAMECD